jgi:hypothetical protein
MEKVVVWEGERERKREGEREGERECKEKLKVSVFLLERNCK